MKKQKRLTKRERKVLEGKKVQARHIHCIACGRHLDPAEFSRSPVTARYISCLHGSKFAVCAACVGAGQELLAEHDRTGAPVQVASVWH